MQVPISRIWKFIQFIQRVEILFQDVEIAQPQQMAQKLPVIKGNSKMLNDYSKKQLSKIGWYNGRNIPTKDMENSLKNNDFIINNEFIKFLSEFGCLFGNIIQRKDNLFFDFISFYVKDISYNYFSDWTNSLYKEIIGENICLVGCL